MGLDWARFGIKLGLNWAKSEAFLDGLLRAIISKRLKSPTDLGLMLNLAQMSPKLIPNLSQLLPKSQNRFFGVFEGVFTS